MAQSTLLHTPPNPSPLIQTKRQVAHVAPQRCGPRELAAIDLQSMKYIDGKDKTGVGRRRRDELNDEVGGTTALADEYFVLLTVCSKERKEKRVARGAA